MAFADAPVEENWPLLHLLAGRIVSRRNPRIQLMGNDVSIVSVCGASIVKIYFVFAVDNSSDSSCKPCDFLRH